MITSRYGFHICDHLRYMVIIIRTILLNLSPGNKKSMKQKIIKYCDKLRQMINIKVEIKLIV